MTKKYVNVRATSKIRRGMLWKEGRHLTPVWADEIGMTVREAGDRYDSRPIAVRLKKK